MKKKYKMETWKLYVEGEYATDAEAIKGLADKYMKISKCDAPGQHPVEMIFKAKKRAADKICKKVWLSVFEEQYGIEQWIIKKCLLIHPFKPEHWRQGEGFEFTECEFKYEETAP